MIVRCIKLCNFVFKMLIMFIGLSSYSQIYVSGPHPENLEDWKKKGAYVTTKNGEVAEEADVIFISVKPHLLPEAIADMYDTLTNLSKVANKLFVSILAGVKLEALENVSILFHSVSNL